VAFTIANISMARCVLPEVVLTLGTVPTVDYETTGTHDLANKIRPFVADHDAILMDRHGAVCLGSSLLGAFCNLETMEHTALITKTARDLGGVKELPTEEAIKLRSMGLKRYGGPPSAVAKADEPGADLPDACLDCSGCPTLDPRGITPSSGLRMARVVEQAMLSVRDFMVDSPQIPEASSAPPPAPTPSNSVEDAVVEEVLRALSGQG